MGWETLAIAGASIIGGMISSDAAGDAADTQAQAARDASGTQLAMFNTARADQEPWRVAGKTALDQLMAGNFQADPGYDFRKSEGEKAINRMAAARGMWNSGPTLRALNRFNQDYATGEYTNWFNRKASIAGLGQTAAQNIGNQGIATGQGIGQNIIGAGNARASGYVGGANAMTGAFGQGMNFYNQNRMLDYIMNRGGGGATPYFAYTGYDSMGGPAYG